MPITSNKLKSNKLKEPKSKPVQKKKKVSVRQRKRKKTDASGFDPRMKRVLGFFFLLSAMYLFLAFSSFLVNWFDANPGNSAAQNLGNYFSDHADIVQNWTGRFGNWLSHMLVLNGVGLGAYTLSIVFIGLGLKLLLNIRMLKLWVWFQILVLGLLWLPMFFNLLYPEHPENILGDSLTVLFLSTVWAT